MSQDHKRRDFFSHIIESLSDVINITNQSVSEDSSATRHQKLSIRSDLPRELLVMEAERLGLDATLDAAEILETITAEMNNLKPEEGEENLMV